MAELEITEAISTTPPPQAPPEAELSYREILRFYFPLALSWIFMALELPINTSVVSRSANAAVQTAALLMLMGLALWIESPVIDLLATSTTLSRTPSDYRLISRFTLWLMGWCTAAHALIALTPLYDVITRTILGIPAPVAEAGRIPMAIMIPWSASIGWRRYLQGILIRFGRTRIIGWGTSVRVSMLAVVCLSLFLTTRLPGVVIAAIALTCSVFSEAIFIQFASRQTVRERLVHEEAERPHEPLTMRRLMRFHFPLTATTITYMSSLPMVSAALAHAKDGVSAMAGWQVATSLVFLHRTVVFALPEPIIALYKGPNSARKLARFCVAVGGISSGLIVLLSFSGLHRLVFVSLLGAKESIVGPASLAYIACFSLPLIGAIQSYLRGMLTALHFTVARLAAVIVSIAVLLACLVLGVRLAWTGVEIAASAMTISAIAETGALGWAWKLAREKAGV